MAKLLSQNEWEYYLGSIKKILVFIKNEQQNPNSLIKARDGGLYTFSVDARELGLSWQLYDTPKLRQVLNTIKERGYLERKELGYNFCTWHITKDGERFLECLDKTFN